MDNYSKYTYVYFQKMLTAAETIEDKKVFNQISQDSDVSVSAYTLAMVS